MRAWIREQGRLELQETAEPVPRSDELLVQVEAISLNRGEVRAATPGWDVAGTVIGGEGFAPGTRIAAILRGGAWAERVAVPAFNAALVPDEVPLTIAATLPLAGLTVMRAFAVGGPLLGKRVLITGASGGVGMLASQLATLGGATVVGVRTADEAEGTFDFILESAGGASLAAAIAKVASGGTVVTIGNSSEQETTFNARTLYAKGGASIYGLLIFEEVANRRIGGRELAYLLELTRTGALKPVIEVERSWRELDATLQDLAARRFHGKAVLRVGT